MKQKIKAFFEKLCSKDPRLASLYYALLSSAMSYEHQTVLNGKLQFKKNSSGVVLRRNTHRLEKGLIMFPRRDVFAKEYILETVHAYKKEILLPITDKASLKWSEDVLSRYFQSVAKDPVIDQAKALFLSSLTKISNENIKSPFERGAQISPVGYDDFYSLAVLRRSVRWYQSKKVPRDKIDKAIELAKLAPSACNRQPFKLKIYDDKDIINTVSSMPGGTAGFSYNFPMIIAVTGQLRNYYSEADRHIIYIDASLFSMAFIMALETLELSSCIINWPDNYAKEVEARKLLNLDDDERVIFFISVGFAAQDRQIPYSQKKSLDELRSYN